MPMSPVTEQLFNLTYAYDEATKGSINNSWYETLKQWILQSVPNLFSLNSKYAPFEFKYC